MPEIPRELGIFEKEIWRIDYEHRQGLYFHHNGIYVGDLRQSLEYPDKMIVRFFAPIAFEDRAPEYVDNILVAAAILHQYKEMLDAYLHHRSSGRLPRPGEVRDLSGDNADDGA